MDNMPSQAVQPLTNAPSQHLQPQQGSHQHPQPLQPINATQALQLQQQKMQINPSQMQPVPAVGPATAAVAAQTRSQHIPTAHHPQYQYQQLPNGAVPGQQHQHVQPQMQQQSLQYQQQQRVNANNGRPQQYVQTQPVVMPTNGNNIPVNPQQQMQPQQIRQAIPQQRNPQYTQPRTQQSQNPPPNPRSIPTPSSQNPISTSPVPTSQSNSHTPLYERLVTEEVKELKEYVRLIEQQSRRIADQEKIHLDLEKRLEEETTQRQRLEYTLQYRERYWKASTEKLVGERTELETKVKEEKIKVERLLDMVNRLQNEIQSMIKNKFNPASRSDGHLPGNSGGIKRVASGQAASVGNRSRSESGASGSRAEGQHPSTSGGGGRNATKRHIGPHELLACNGSAEAVRERNAFTSLLDFFGM